MNQLPPSSELMNSQYEEKLKGYGVTLFRDPVVKGAFKRLYPTSDPAKIALLSSPRKAHDKSWAIWTASKEISILQELREAPHIPVCYDSFSVLNERYCLIQENYGKDLSYTNGPLPFSEVRKVAKNHLEALVYMHERNIGHFDIKPANMTEKGLIDFGAAEKLQDYEPDGRFATRNGRTGTSGYWPPEVVYHHRKYLVSDIFSLGISLFEIFNDTNFFPVGVSYEKDPLQHDIDQLRVYEMRMGLTLSCQPKVKDCFGPEGTLKQSRIERLDSFSLTLDRTAVRSKISLTDPLFLAFAKLLCKMLDSDYKKRITAKEALAHPFFQETTPEK